MQNETQILDKIRIVVTEILEINPEDIIPSANIRDDLRADSLASAEIVMALEDAFNIQFDENKVNELIYVKDLIVAISQQLTESTSTVE